MNYTMFWNHGVKYWGNWGKKPKVGVVVKPSQLIKEEKSPTRKSINAKE